MGPDIGPSVVRKSSGTQREIRRDDVYKVDETGVNWKALPSKSLASKQESTARGAKECMDELCPFFLNGTLKTSFPMSRNFVNVKGKQAVLLIINNAPCHPPVEILNAIDDDFSVMYLPPSVTALVQPMDQGVIEKLKRIY
ncbi:HTH CENPB-type domain-containing protein [Trichonephila clavipes]|nr:HTH CENPB-type domain-containing protein [Trichonephila clavipes]